MLYLLKKILILVGGLEHLDYVSIQLGTSSSQLTNSIIFRGVGSTTNQVNHWLMASNIFYFPFHIWDVILAMDFHIFQAGFFFHVETTKQDVFIV